MGNPHILAIPMAAQGHVIPLMELALSLVEYGVKVTFVNTEFTHNRVLKTFSKTNYNTEDMINLVSLPDGLEPEDDRNDLVKLLPANTQVMPGKLHKLIENINNTDNDRISCVIADQSIGWAFEVAEKMGIRRAAFWPAAAAALLDLQFSIPKLIEDGIINIDGTLLKKQIIQLSPSMPPMNSANFIWNCFGDLHTQRVIFDVFNKNNETVKLAEWVICNSIYELEPAAFALFPKILPVGPLLASNRLGKSAGHFWQEDSSCIAWLNQQKPRSVIYIAFGSFAVFDKIQFNELALGLELTSRPFLWVVRPDMTDDIENGFPKGFKDRIRDRGFIVSWAPQQEVLRHPSIACFISHCGWNSTMEGVSNGVQFLCWPYFADQFLNTSYICDEWKVGLGFNRDTNGIIRKGEIKSKVDQLLSDEIFRGRALDLREKVTKSVTKNGCSSKHFASFVTWIKEKQVDN